MRRHLEPDEWTSERGDIFALYRELGVADDRERHRLQHAITGCSSLRFMTRAEHRKLTHTLTQLTHKTTPEQEKLIAGLLALSGFDYRDIDA